MLTIKSGYRIFSVTIFKLHAWYLIIIIYNVKYLSNNVNRLYVDTMTCGIYTGVRYDEVNKHKRHEHHNCYIII